MPPRRPSIVKDEEVMERLDEEPAAQLANGSIEDDKDNLIINEVISISIEADLLVRE